jgi:hypothetical protein
MQPPVYVDDEQGAVTPTKETSLRLPRTQPNGINKPTKLWTEHVRGYKHPASTTEKRNSSCLKHTTRTPQGGHLDRDIVGMTLTD